MIESNMTSQDIHVETCTIPHQQTHQGRPFPLAFQCRSPSSSLDHAVKWVDSHRESLVQQCETHGAVLFRGFPLSTSEDFDTFIKGFGLENFPYEQSLSNAVRVNFTPRVFSANEAPSEVTIFLHHEMAQTPIYPGKLFFFCQKPADSGGATPLCRSDVLFDRMLEECPDFANSCASKGLKYTTIMPSENDAASGLGRSWQSTFRAESRAEAEMRMRELNYSWEWLEDGTLKSITPTLPAVHELPSGSRSFFNQLIAAFQGWKDSRNDPSKSITLGDGTPLAPDLVLKVAGMAEDLTFDVEWQAGDVAFVDNISTMHARRSFEGTRKILASLVAATAHADT